MRNKYFNLLLVGVICFQAAACASEGETPVFHSFSLLTGAKQKVGTTQSGNYLAGRQALKKQDFYSASHYLEKALKDSPSNSFLLQRTFSSKLAVGDVAAAARIARTLAKSNISEPIASLVIVIDEINDNKFKKAQKTLELVSDEGIYGPVTSILKAWIMVGLGRGDRAVEELQPLKARPGLRPFYETQTALMLDAVGKFDAALVHYNLAVRHLRQPSLRLVQTLGQHFERLGQSDKANQLYVEYMKENPDAVALQPALERISAGTLPPPLVANAREGVAEALYTIASMMTRQNAGWLALIYGRLATHLRPNLDLGYMLIARILESMGRYKEAIKTYQNVSKKSPLNWAARLNISDNLASLDRDEEAISLLKAMSAEDDSSVAPLISLGDLLRANKRFPEAIRAYDWAVKLLGKVEKRHWVIFYSRGISLERSSQWNRAEKDFQRALELKPDQPYVLNYLGYSWVDQGINLGRARQMIERAVELRPNDGYIVDSLGWVLYRLKNFAGAVGHLERAVELRPQDPIINDHLGDAYWRTGRFTEARFQWQRALSLQPEPEQVEIIEAKLLRGLGEQTDTEKGG